MRGVSERILGLLQFTRLALVFTAIADSLCALLLRWGWQQQQIGGSWARVVPQQVFVVALISAALWGFGMSLNDIIDHRRDRQLAAYRPLPSGRIGVLTAHVICILLGLTALLAGAAYANLYSDHWGWLSFVLIVWIVMLIVFYDVAGKYLVAPGLLTLGLIRFFHATFAAPELPLLWHPLLLLNHVTIVSTVAYVWEEKRPSLTRVHWWAVMGGLGLVDALAVTVVAMRNALRMRGALLLPLAAAIWFVVLALLIRRLAPTRRMAGQRLMLCGLLWLIVYDAAFVAGYVSFTAAGLMLLLLPLAYVAVQMMRWWNQLLALSRTPQFHRAGRSAPPR
jgi:hypothetical protein